jgi:alkanesulfonate monooxygenase SsuD/methylene tetrahydromethanopterin reductase-like flavin-dependent oxidoreductase (luciferase family)
VVTFTGQFETVTGAGLAPMPVQRPIPIWIGGGSEPALRRLGRLADGWFPPFSPGQRFTDALALIHESAKASERDPATIGVEGRVSLAGGAAVAAKSISDWRLAGATHVSINTMGLRATGVDAHIAALTEVADLAGLPRRSIS